MADVKEVNTISDEELKSVLHPTESSRFTLALVIAVPVAIVAVIFTFITAGAVILFLGLLVFFIWFGLEIAKASLVANSLRVSKDNFPEVHNIYLDVCRKLNYKGNIEIFIVNEGSVNAFISKFFRTKFIILNSGLVSDMISGDKIIQMQWIIGRFIGALKAKHLRLEFLKIIVSSIEQIKIFNLFILPYERATQYSGDQIGLVACGDLHNAMIAFDKFLVGNELSNRVNFRGIIDQSYSIKNGFFAFIARIFSTHPHLTDRYLNLLAFSKWRYPELFNNYLTEFSEEKRIEIAHLLPHYFDNKRAMLQ